MTRSVTSRYYNGSGAEMTFYMVKLLIWGHGWLNNLNRRNRLINRGDSFSFFTDSSGCNGLPKKKNVGKCVEAPIDCVTWQMKKKNTQNKFEINSESVLIYKSDFVMLVRILTQPVFSWSSKSAVIGLVSPMCNKNTMFLTDRRRLHDISPLTAIFHLAQPKITQTV